MTDRVADVIAQLCSGDADELIQSIAEVTESPELHEPVLGRVAVNTAPPPNSTGPPFGYDPDGGAQGDDRRFVTGDTAEQAGLNLAMAVLVGRLRPDVASSLTHLELYFRYFALDDEQMDELADAISTTHPSLVAVTCDVDAVPAASRISSLEELDICDFDYRGGEDDLEIALEYVGELQQLRSLTVQAFSLPEKLPSEIGQLHNLERLALHGAELYLPDNFPQELAELPKLQTVELRAPHGRLPDVVMQMPHLRSLDVSDLPDNIGDIATLERLKAIYCGLTELPASIGRLANLQHLDLTGNQLSSLPDQVGQLTELRELNLSEHEEPIEALPDAIGECAKLETLVGYFAHLPDALGGLSELRSLNLTLGSYAQNSTIALPASVAQLQNLEELTLRFISELPALVAELSGLKRLRLTGSVSQLPDEIGQLEHLEILDLWLSKVRDLPPSLDARTDVEIRFEANSRW